MLQAIPSLRATTLLEELQQHLRAATLIGYCARSSAGWRTGGRPRARSAI
jgi:hypothetical protein